MSKRKTALSEQQIRIVTLASTRMTNRHIADRLGVTEGSIDTQFQRMRVKLDTKNRADTIQAAMEYITEREGQENQRLAELAHGMPILLVAFDNNYCVVATNDATDATFLVVRGRPDEGRRVWREITPGASERKRLRHNSVGVVFDYNDHRVRMTDIDGGRRVISWFSAAESHPIPGWHSWAVGVDVTPSEDAEVLSRLRLAASDAGGQGVWLLDDGFKTLYTNPAVADILESTESELALKTPLDFIPDEMKTAAYDFIKQGGGTLEMTLTTALGNPRLVRKTLLFGETGFDNKPEGYAVLIDAL